MQPSCSLQHVPLDTKRETNLPAGLQNRLAFAQQKLAELQALAGSDPAASKAASGGKGAAAKRPDNGGVSEDMLKRGASYEERRAAQAKAMPEVRKSAGDFMLCGLYAHV